MLYVMGPLLPLLWVIGLLSGPYGLVSKNFGATAYETFKQHFYIIITCKQLIFGFFSL